MYIHKNEFAVVRLAIKHASFDRPAKSWTGSGEGENVSLTLPRYECQAYHLFITVIGNDFPEIN
jgi:hypothetical protein